jgi:hypothetical protein
VPKSRAAPKRSHALAQPSVIEAGAQSRSPLPPMLRIASVATGIEALALAASAVGLTLYQLLGHRPLHAADSWGVVAMSAVGATAVGAVTGGLLRARRWSRSPAVFVQLIAVPVGGSAIGNGAPYLGVPLMVCGLAALVGLLAPSTTQRLGSG